MKWIVEVVFPNSSRLHNNQELNNENDLTILILQCQKILRYYDLFVCDSPIDSIEYNDMIHNPTQVEISTHEEIDYFILPINQVIIYGRCRDYYALTIDKTRSFLCIKTLFSSTTSSSSTCTNHYKVSISNLSSYHEQLKRIGLDQIQVIAKHLSNHHVNVLLTCDVIEGEILSTLVNYGIYTVSKYFSFIYKY